MPPTPGVSEARAREIFAQLVQMRAERTPALLVDAAVDPRELGYADYGTRTIYLSPTVLARSEDHVASVLAHELGHLSHGPATLPPPVRRLALATFLGGALGVLGGALVAALSTASSGHPSWTFPLMVGGVLLAHCGPALSLAQDRRAELRVDAYAATLLRDTPWDATAALRDTAPRRSGPLRLLDTHPSHRRRLRRMTTT